MDINKFTGSIDNKLCNRLRRSTSDTECRRYLMEHAIKQLSTHDVSDCNSVVTTWDIRECFKQLRLDKNSHLGLGDIRLTIAQQEEICDLVERFYS